MTTKMIKPAGSVALSYAAMKTSVERIGLGSVNLFLIHIPNIGPEGRREMWAALEQLNEDGLAKSIGVSNYGVRHLQEMKSYAKSYPPAVNQIEVRWTLGPTAISSLTASSSSTRGSSSMT